jgi:hypothetical protein
MSTRSIFIFKDLIVAKHLPLLHDKYVIVSTDKELGIDNSLGNPKEYLNPPVHVLPIVWHNPRRNPKVF